jgi:hypothetical protein
MPCLRKHDYGGLIAARGRAIKKTTRRRATGLSRRGRPLFHDPSIDAKVLLREKEVLEDLENAIDKCETSPSGSRTWR